MTTPDDTPQPPVTPPPYPPQSYPPQSYPPQSYPPQSYPPQSYPPQPYYAGYPPPQTTSGKAIAILVLGIAGIVVGCGIGAILGIVALSLAPGGRREIAASGGRLGGEGFIKAGVICSWIAIGLTAVSILIFLAAVGGMFAVD